MLETLCLLVRCSGEYNEVATTQILETSNRNVKFSMIFFFSPINDKTNGVEDACMTSFTSNYCQNYAF